MAREWFQDYFDELYIRSHGLRLDGAPAEAAFMAEKLELAPGAAVLDLACGHGRHSVELARLGYKVTGLDLSTHLLSKGVELAREAGVKVEFVEEDMRSIPETWAARFDGIVNVFTAWGYFEKDADSERVIEGVSRSLKLDGRFLLDVINREWLVRNFTGRSWFEGQEGTVTVEDSRLDLAESRTYTDFTVILPDGRRTTRHVTVRLFTLAEVAAMSERHGLKVIDTFGGWTGEPYGLDSRRMMVLAQRER